MPEFLKTGSSPKTNGGAQTLDVPAIVKGVIDDIRARGDEAVRSYSEKFDKWSPASFRLSKSQIDEIISTVPEQIVADIKTAQRNVRAFAEAQRGTITDLEIEISPGVHLGHRNIPIDCVGAYIPGGRYPLLASAHMTILTAKVAGVPKVVACTPPINGQIPSSTVAAMHHAGADEIWILGGVQAIAAMALGTETMPKANFIAGPGNAFVAEAKRQLFGDIGIDLPAGPTEVLIVADHKADPTTVAVDLLSQAEHGPDSPAVLITTSREVGEASIREVDRLLKILPTAPIASVSWDRFGEVVLVETLDEAYKLADDYTFEHVQVLTENPREALEKMSNYGALFLGEKTCVSYGDKVIGTNHVLPTKKAGRFTGGLWVGKFLKTVTYQEVTSESQSGELGRLCGRAARAENFEGHARSGDLRAHLYLGDDVRCSLRDSRGPCQRCRKRNIECVWKRSSTQLDTSSEEFQGSPLTRVVEDLQMLHAAVNKILASNRQLPLDPLRSISTDIGLPPLESQDLQQHQDEPDNGEPTTRDEDTSIRDSVEPLNQVPIKSLYEVTQLGSLRPRQLSPPRSANDTTGSTRLLSDIVSQGKLDWNDALRLTMRFLNKTDYYLYGILHGFDSIESIRHASPLLFTAICTVSALHEPHGEALFKICSLELRTLISSFVFAPKATVHDFQGLCIASFWLSDISWSVSGLAIRRAIEFQLEHSFEIVVGDKQLQRRSGTKIQFTSDEDALSCLRVWYLFFVCDHHMSILYGRPSSFGVQAAVNNWERYFKAMPQSITDTRISSQIELVLILEKVTQLLGPDIHARTPLIFKAQLELFGQQLDQWVSSWTIRYEQHQRIGEYPRKSLTIHYLFARLFLTSHVFRGLSSDPKKDPIPHEFYDMAQDAVRSARSIIDLVTGDETMKAAFVGMPHYYHTFVAYSCSFLLKLHTEYHRHLGLGRQDILSAISRVIELCQRTPCASYHLVRWMGAGLQKLSKNYEAALAKGAMRRQEPALASEDRMDQLQTFDGEIGSEFRTLEDSEARWDMPRDAEGLFSEICQDVIPSTSPIGNNLYPADGSMAQADAGQFDQYWGFVSPTFGSEYLGFGLL
ncbi:unnamed protein product [Clonostachys rhizophaga]|uniref:Histidinol dehydrogenase n=1 Tax=Clonostachys rhizophaga TaxID=160324 RepID=A0A9N9YJX1_9HYPO|nr:unnamed protein product [Clonostachys rhizophaga]